MALATPPAPYLHGGNRVSRVMGLVLLALLPGLVGAVALLGWGVLVNVAVAAIAALTVEAALLHVRGYPVRHFLGDGSAVLMGVLLGLCLPPLLPAWIVVVGVAFGLTFGKHVYGGLGSNPFNPAMVGYAALLLAFPQAMVLWPAPEAAPGLLESARIALAGVGPDALALDGFTGATPLDHLRAARGDGASLEALRGGPAFGAIGAARWEWIGLLFGAGGAWLLWKRVIRWQIPVGVLAGLALPAAVAFALDPAHHLPPHFQLLAGGAMLGAFFIATDPVSAPSPPWGRLLFGLGIGVLAWSIRTWGGYPDGIAFAVLLMNATVPLLERFTRPRTRGRP